MARQETLDRQPEIVALRHRQYSWWRDPMVRIYRDKPLGLLGFVLMAVMVFTGIFANVLMPYTYFELAGPANTPPSLAYPMGTDQLGRDILSRIIYGARISMFIGMGTVCASATVAIILGVTSAWLGGKVDLVFQRLVDAVQSIPSLVLLLTIVSVLGVGIVNIMVALAMQSSITQSRIIRSAVLGIKENQYIDAARAIGATDLRILIFYIMPNVMAPIIVMASVALGGYILAESSLSFLGFGVPPPVPTWGQMLSSDGRSAMLSAPWLAVFPGLALSGAVFGINMLGDALRDVLDPRLRGGR